MQIKCYCGLILDALKNKRQEIAGEKSPLACVKVSDNSTEDYFKRHLNAPDLMLGDFKLWE